MTDSTWESEAGFRPVALPLGAPRGVPLGVPLGVPSAAPLGALRWRPGPSAEWGEEWRSAGPALALAALLATLGGLALGSAAHGLLLFAALLAWAGGRQLLVRHRWGSSTVSVIGPVVSIVDRRGRLRGAFDLDRAHDMEVHRGDPAATHLSGLLTTVTVRQRAEAPGRVLGEAPVEVSVFPLHLTTARDADALVEFLHAAARRRGVPFVSS